MNFFPSKSDKYRLQAKRNSIPAQFAPNNGQCRDRGIRLGGANPGQTGANPGQPGVNPGQPGVNPGQPGVNLGQPGVNPGQPGVNLGQPGANLGQPRANLGPSPNPTQDPGAARGCGLGGTNCNASSDSLGSEARNRRSSSAGIHEVFISCENLLNLNDSSSLNGLKSKDSCNPIPRNRNRSHSCFNIYEHNNARRGSKSAKLFAPEENCTNYLVHIDPGHYEVNISLPSAQKPNIFTLSLGKKSRWKPCSKQEPLLYDDVTPPSPTSFSRKLVNRLLRSSGSGDANAPSERGVVLSENEINQAKGRYRLAERKKAEGNELYKNKQYRDALKIYSEAIDLCPECASYFSNRSACNMMLGRYTQALSDAREAVRLDPKFVKGYIRVAKCNNALGDATAALSILRQAAEMDSTNKAIKEEMATANALLGCLGEVEKAVAEKDFRKAIFHLDRSLHFATGCRSLKITKAEYLVYLQRYAEAQEIANEILQFDSSNADAIYVRGMCLYYQDNQEAAFNHFQHVLRLAPDHKKAKDTYKKAKMLKQKKEEGNYAFSKSDFKDALKLYTDALAIDVNNKTTNSKLYCNRATVKAKLGLLKEAVDDCTAAINLNENYVKAFLRRAKCYQELEKHEDAVRDYEKVYKLDRNQEHKRYLHDAKLQLKVSKRKDYYKILGISRNASEDDIKKSYRKMALQHHPDRHANATTSEKEEHEIKFKEIGEAYAVLTDAKKRAMYDRGQDINDPEYGPGYADIDPSHIFQTFFGHGGSSFDFGHHQGFGFPEAGFPGGGGGGGFPAGFHFQFS